MTSRSRARAPSARREGNPVADDRAVAVRLVRDGPVAPIRIWVDVGRYEPLFEPNEAMASLLERRGWDVTYRRDPAGHTFTAWMEELFLGLPALLPPGDRR